MGSNKGSMLKSGNGSGHGSVVKPLGKKACKLSPYQDGPGMHKLKEIEIMYVVQSLWHMDTRVGREQQ